MDTPVPSILVTRPAREAHSWVRMLEARGLQAQALPLIDIAPAPDARALEQARDRLAGFQAVMFVSANAVDGFLGDHLAWPPGPRCWATGPGTRDALLRGGVPAPQVDAPAADAMQFDSERLWEQVRGQARPGVRVLIVRGGDAQGQLAGRPWLAGQLAGAGVAVEQVVSYVRRLPSLDAAQQAFARSAAKGQGWWLFSSSEALDNLQQLLPGQDWSAARALCTHPRIAHAARAMGFGTVAEARPSLDDVAAFLQS